MATRRRFLSAALAGLSRKSEKPIAGGFVNEAQLLGHRLRDRQAFAKPLRQRKIPVVIVGGGMAGLSAAWRLNKSGFHDFVLLEMEKQPGGNARWGENEVSAYPWAAHYLPVPNREAAFVRELCEETGLLREGKWEERHLCHSPQERLFLHGRWQEGLEPDVGVTPEHRRQFKRFEEILGEYRASGAFTIPMDPGLHARGAKFASLDRLSMFDWMRQQRLGSPYLDWYVDYACRDDYGASARDTSAFAGIHYFAAREHEDKGPLTWPEGNGWLLKRLLERVGKYVQSGAIVYRIEADRNRWRVFTESTEYLADRVIYAAPLFLLPYIVPALPAETHVTYSPWLTANLTLDRWPREATSTEPAWDNVIFDSPSLGYVIATHQNIRSHIDRTVWTFYWALAEGSAADMRRKLLANDWAWWKEAILNDLGKAHPDIRDCVSSIDIMRLGHAMARPTPGTIFAEWRRRLPERFPNFLFAHSDLSGLSIFEEAQFHGVNAADRVLHRL